MFLPREADMTKQDFAEAVCRLVGYYADEGIGRETLPAVIEGMAAVVLKAPVPCRGSHAAR